MLYSAQLAIVESLELQDFSGKAKSAYVGIHLLNVNGWKRLIRITGCARHEINGIC